MSKEQYASKGYVKGTISEKHAIETFASGFRKQTLKIHAGGSEEYPLEVHVQFLKDNTDLITNFEAGDHVEVYAEIKTREYNGRGYTDVMGFRIKHVETEAPASQPLPEPKPAPLVQMPTTQAVEEDEPLPF